MIPKATRFGDRHEFGDCIGSGQTNADDFNVLGIDLGKESSAIRVGSEFVSHTTSSRSSALADSLVNNKPDRMVRF